MTVNDELKRLWMEATMTYSNAEINNYLITILYYFKFPDITSKFRTVAMFIIVNV
jgi:hypothetical protein